MALLIGGDVEGVGADFGDLHLLGPLRTVNDPFGHAFQRRLKPYLDPQNTVGIGVDPDVISDPLITIGIWRESRTTGGYHQKDDPYPLLKAGFVSHWITPSG